MAVNAARTTTITFTGDVQAQQTVAAAANAASPGQIDVVTLTTGANTITAPTGGTTPKCLTIIPPTGNVATLTLKGLTGDTGVPLHLTDPSSIALAGSFASLVITAGATVTGLRLIWS